MFIDMKKIAKDRAAALRDTRPMGAGWYIIIGPSGKERWVRKDPTGKFERGPLVRRKKKVLTDTQKAKMFALKRRAQAKFLRENFNNFRVQNKKKVQKYFIGEIEKFEELEKFEKIIEKFEKSGERWAMRYYRYGGLYK